MGRYMIGMRTESARKLLDAYWMAENIWSLLMGKHRDYLNYQVMTAREIADKMGNITGSGVDKLTTSAMKKLRRNPILFLHWVENGPGRSTGNIGTES
jgi:hypothetical protein